MRNIINKILRKTIGYHMVKFDDLPYKFREKLKWFLLSNVVEGEILEIGSGSWSYPKDILSGKNITTLDIKPPADVIGSVMKLPFKENTFDCVICFETLEHVENPFKAIEEIFRVLKQGGKFIGSAPFMNELHGEEYGDYWRFTRQGWAKLLSRFENINIIPYSGKSLSPGWYFVTAKK